MSLEECLEKTTHTQYLTWMCKFQEDETRLELTHFYLMQIAQRILQSQSKNPNKHTLEQQELKVGGKEEKPLLTLEEADAISKSNWKTRLGIVKPRVTKQQEIEDKSYILGENK